MSALRKAEVEGDTRGLARDVVRLGASASSLTCASGLRWPVSLLTRRHAVLIEGVVDRSPDAAD